MRVKLTENERQAREILFNMAQSGEFPALEASRSRKHACKEVSPRWQSTPNRFEEERLATDIAIFLV